MLTQWLCSMLGETLDVSAEAPLLQTNRTSVSGAVGAEMIEALPNITQNPLAYAFLRAGAVPRLNATNVLNHTQFRDAYNGGLGGTVTTANPALGLMPGMGNANTTACAT